MDLYWPLSFQGPTFSSIAFCTTKGNPRAILKAKNPLLEGKNGEERVRVSMLQVQTSKQIPCNFFFFSLVCSAKKPVSGGRLAQASPLTISVTLSMSGSISLSQSPHLRNHNIRLLACERVKWSQTWKATHIVPATLEKRSTAIKVYYI